MIFYSILFSVVRLRFFSPKWSFRNPIRYHIPKIRGLFWRNSKYNHAHTPGKGLLNIQNQTSGLVLYLR